MKYSLLGAHELRVSFETCCIHLVRKSIRITPLGIADDPSRANRSFYFRILFSRKLCRYTLMKETVFDISSLTLNRKQFDDNNRPSSIHNVNKRNKYYKHCCE